MTGARTPLRLFVRQAFTESGLAQRALVAGALAELVALDGKPHALRFLTGLTAESGLTFREAFMRETGQPFTPDAFRRHRLALLGEADAFICIRVALSESTAFELAHHLYAGRASPVLMLVWEGAPIKTTLLRDLDAVADVTYAQFANPSEIASVAQAFLGRAFDERAERHRPTTRRSAVTTMAAMPAPTRTHTQRGE